MSLLRPALSAVVVACLAFVLLLFHAEWNSKRWPAARVDELVTLTAADESAPSAPGATVRLSSTGAADESAARGAGEDPASASEPAAGENLAPDDAEARAATRAAAGAARSSAQPAAARSSSAAAAPAAPRRPSGPARPRSPAARGAAQDAQAAELRAAAAVRALELEGEQIGGFPYLMLLGTSKGGSTFLFECMEQAFHPRVVCGADNASRWTREFCGERRFLLPAVRLHYVPPDAAAGRAQPTVRINSIKENYVFTRGMYRGPTVEPERQRFYRGPKLPLSFWEHRRWTTSDPAAAREMLRATMRACAEHVGANQSCPLRDFRAEGRPYSFRGMENAREGEGCGFKRGPPPPDDEVGISTHPLCKARGRGYVNRNLLDVRAFPPVPPDAPPGEPWRARLLAYDGCPYNLGSARAPDILQHMFSSARAAAAMRFIVLLRDPIDRAYSEWAMTNRWRGQMHAGGTFWRHARQQVAELRECLGAELAPMLHGNLSDARFVELYHECISADYYSYIKNSLYGLHLRNWLRYFPPESFLLMETEKMARMKAPQLLAFVARFTGLHFDAAEFARHPSASSVRRACEPKPKGNRSPNLKSDGSTSTPVDPRARAALHRFFFPDGATPRMHMLPPPQLQVWADRVLAAAASARAAAASAGEGSGQQPELQAAS